MIAAEPSIRSNSITWIKRAFWWVLCAATALQLVWSSRVFLDFGKLFVELRDKSLIERASIGISEWQSFLARSGRRKQQETFAKVHREIAQASENGKLPVRIIFSKSGMIIVNPRARSPSRTVEPITVVRSETELLPDVLATGSSTFVHSEKEFASDVEASWSFAAEQEVPNTARVFLNERSFALYLVGTFIWYPAQVRVDLNRAEIRNDETFEAAFNNVSGLNRDDLQSLRIKLRPVGYTHLVTRDNGALKMVKLGQPRAADSE